MFKMSDINVNAKMQISDLYMSQDINVNAKIQISDLYMYLDINVSDGRRLFRWHTIDERDSQRLANSPGRLEANAILRV